MVSGLSICDNKFTTTLKDVGNGGRCGKGLLTGSEYSFILKGCVSLAEERRGTEFQVAEIDRLNP